MSGDHNAPHDWQAVLRQRLRTVLHRFSGDCPTHTEPREQCGCSDATLWEDGRWTDEQVGRCVGLERSYVHNLASGHRVSWGGKGAERLVGWLAVKVNPVVIATGAVPRNPETEEG